jgi:hypothetical protein
MTETAETTGTVAPATGEQAAAAPAAAPKTARFKLPTGVVTPIELRNELVKLGLAQDSLKPQQMYAYVKSPGKTNPFPVKFYEEDGTVHDTQPGGILTRPGIPTMDEGVAWYKNRATATTATATATASTTPAELADVKEDETEDGDTEDAPDFEEAE